MNNSKVWGGGDMCKHIHMYGMLPADTIDMYIPWPTQIGIV